MSSFIEAHSRSQQGDHVQAQQQINVNEHLYFIVQVSSVRFSRVTQWPPSHLSPPTHLPTLLHSNSPVHLHSIMQGKFTSLNRAALSQYMLSSGKDGSAALWELSTGRDIPS